MSNDDTNTTPQTPPATPETGIPETDSRQSATRSPRRRTGLAVAGVATVVLLSAGVGAGFAVALSDDDDDRTSFTSSSSDDGSSVSGETDLDGMLDAATTALTAADGEVVAIEERTDGTWRVDVQRDGREVEVEVDGSDARVVEEDEDGDRDEDGAEDGADLPLTADTVRSLVDAATGETDGRVVQVSSDDDGYSVEVLTATSSVVEVDLDAAFQVVTSERDDD